MPRPALDSFFGGPPAWVLLRLVILSLVLGVIMAALNLDVFKLFEGLRDLVEGILNLGWDAIESVLRYFLLGAAIVFPIWLIMRLFSVAGRNRNG